MPRTRLYSLILIACFAGYAWLGYLQYKDHRHQETSVCLIKELTSVPCPSCGSSRAVLSIMDGDFIGALHWNPFGYILTLIMLISPVWIIRDLILHKNSFYGFYQKIESLLRVKWVAVLLISVVIVNWIWNITKTV